MEPVTPRHLHVAARVADALVYAVGLAGVIAGGLLLRADQVGFALVAWALTFVGGAGLRLAAWATRALAELLIRTSRMESDLARLLAERPPQGPAEPPRPGRWGGWHH